MKRIAAILVVLLMGLMPCSIAAGEAVVARGAALVNACAACHGPNGRSQGPIPSIDNLPAADFVTALKAFRDDTRDGTVMNLIAKGLDEADIRAMATYFASRQGR